MAANSIGDSRDTAVGSRTSMAPDRAYVLGTAGSTPGLGLQLGTTYPHEGESMPGSGLVACRQSLREAASSEPSPAPAPSSTSKSRVMARSSSVVSSLLLVPRSSSTGSGRED